MRNVCMSMGVRKTSREAVFPFPVSRFVFAKCIIRIIYPEQIIMHMPTRRRAKAVERQGMQACERGVKLHICKRRHRKL